MITLEQMSKAEDKHINLYFTDGDVWKNKKCVSFENSGDEDEEYALYFDAPNGNLYEVKQSKIEKIEILD